MGINVLSVFDGMSCGQIALERANVNVDNYFASEIKKHAIDLVRRRFPKTIQLGNVEQISFSDGRFFVQRNSSSWLDVPGEYKIDLFIGGSPCKGISKLNQKQQGLMHNESILFWQYLRLLKEIQKYNPSVKFLLENTQGNKEAIDTITKELGVRPIKINSSIVSAQNRIRYYWTNIPVNTIPKNKHLTTKDILDDTMPDDLIISDGRIKWLNNESGKKSIKKGYTKINPYPKSGCITANGHKKWNCNYIHKDGVYRVLSILELERLQTLPQGYCDGLDYGDAYDLIGDGWTIEIIEWIFKHLQNDTF